MSGGRYGLSWELYAFNQKNLCEWFFCVHLIRKFRMDYSSQTARKSFFAWIFIRQIWKIWASILFKRKFRNWYIFGRTSKTSKSLVFCNFQGVEKEKICMIWVNSLSKYHFLFDPWHYQVITSAQLLTKSE